MSNSNFVDYLYKVVADKTLCELAADFRDMRVSIVEMCHYSIARWMR